MFKIKIQIFSRTQGVDSLINHFIRQNLLATVNYHFIFQLRNVTVD